MYILHVRRSVKNNRVDKYLLRRLTYTSQFWHMYAMNCRAATASGPEVIKLFSYSTQLSTKFILLINDEMPTFISMINTTSEIPKARHFFIWRYFSFYEQLKFRAQLS